MALCHKCTVTFFSKHVMTKKNAASNLSTYHQMKWLTLTCGKTIPKSNSQQRNTVVQFEAIIKPDPTFIRLADKRKTKQKEKTRLCLMKLTATTPAIQWITWFSKHNRTKLPTNLTSNIQNQAKKITTTKHGLLEVNTITNQGIPINKEIENETNTSTAYKSLPLPQSETVQILLSNKRMKMKQKKEMN